MTIDEFSKHLIEKTVTELSEKSKCNHTGAGTSCPVHGDADCNSSKQNRAEEIDNSNLMPEELIGTTYEIPMEDGETIIIEKKNAAGKEQGADGKACWKGYKYAGTENGKDKCVKSEETEFVNEADKKAENKFHKKLDKLVHKTFGHSSDEKKMKKEEVENIEEKRDMPGNQEKIDANKNGKVDAHDFALLRARKSKKTVKEMWEKAAEIAEAKTKTKIEIMPTVDDNPAERGEKESSEISSDAKNSKYDAKKKKMKEEVEPLEEKKLSAAEKAKKEKFVKGMKKKFGSFKSKYGDKAKEVMYGTATSMAKKAA